METKFLYIIRNTKTDESFVDANGQVCLFKGRQSAKPTRDELNQEAGKDNHQGKWVISRGW